MTKLILALAALSLTSACASGLTSFTSSTPGVLVKIEGFGECTTPCTAEIGQVVDVTAAKAGYEAQRFRVAPGTRNININMQLAAPTGGVEENTLPDL